MTAPDATPARGDVEYQRGYRDGWLEGQREGLKHLANAVALQPPAPIVMTADDFALRETIATLTAERDALAQRVRELEGIFDDVEQITLTRNHPEFGRECTVIIDDAERYASVVHQPDDWTAVRAAKAAALALRATPEAPDA